MNFRTRSWSGVVIETEASKKREDANSRFEMLSFWQSISVQR